MDTTATAVTYIIGGPIGVVGTRGAGRYGLATARSAGSEARGGSQAVGGIALAGDSGACFRRPRRRRSALKAGRSAPGVGRQPCGGAIEPERELQ